MSQSSGIPLEELRPHMFLLRDRDATGHLMRCAAPAPPPSGGNDTCPQVSQCTPTLQLHTVARQLTQRSALSQANFAADAPAEVVGGCRCQAKKQV